MFANRLRLVAAGKTNRAIAAGALTIDHRNEWLPEMAVEVAELVLGDNDLQGQAISIAAWKAIAVSAPTDWRKAVFARSPGAGFRWSPRTTR